MNKSDNDYINSAITISNKAKQAFLNFLGTGLDIRNEILIFLTEELKNQQAKIIKENQKDLDLAKKNELSSAMIDRLRLDEQRMAQLIQSVFEIVSLPNPLGEIVNSTLRENGLHILQERVPLGVVMVIFESRPNVVIDIASLAIKSGNAAILRGGKEALHTNVQLGYCLNQALKKMQAKHPQINSSLIQVLETSDRDLSHALLQQNEFIDIVVPRGGSSLIKYVSENSSIPVIKHDAGICHLYIHKDANREMSLDIAVNCKVQRPGVCNAIENLVIHQDFPDTLLLLETLTNLGVEIRIDENLKKDFPQYALATAEDFHTEYLDLILSVKQVRDEKEAINFINAHSSLHTEAIITENYQISHLFQEKIDSACVMVNASTRFSDGGCFGLGAEVGISTQKLHVRGPMGVRDLTCLKYKVLGNGQIR